MIDIANAFTDAGWDVSLITGRLVQRTTPLHPSVKVQKIVRYRRNNTLQRILTWGLGFVQLFLRVVFQHRKAHLFIVTNPPIAAFLPLFVKNSFSLLIFDIYPDVVLNRSKSRQSRKWFVRWSDANKRVFRKADRIYTISGSMREKLGQYIDKGRVEVISLWSDNKMFKPVPQQDNPFIINHGFDGKFIVLYSGNIGLTHGVEVLPKVGLKIRHQDILFVIIGEGEKKRTIERMVMQNGLSNFVFLPWQSPEVLPYSLASASLAVIGLSLIHI